MSGGDLRCADVRLCAVCCVSGGFGLLAWVRFSVLEAIVSIGVLFCLGIAIVHFLCSSAVSFWGLLVVGVALGVASATQCCGVAGSVCSHVCGFWILSTQSLSSWPVAMICSLLSW